MALGVRWSLEAEGTFDGIIEFIQSKWSEKEVRNFVHKSLKVISQIQTNPYQFKSSKRYYVRKGLITKHISLFYYVNEKEGLIDLILY